MYISGSLNNKTINFYREKMTSYDSDAIYTKENSLSYDGELFFTPWNNKKEQELIRRQNLYISKLRENILSLLSTKYFNARCGTDYYIYLNTVKNILNEINNSSPKLNVALFECLYTLIKDTNNNYLHSKLNKFLNLIDYLNNNESQLNQREIDIILKLFLNQQNYLLENVLRYKIRYFKIDEKRITDSTVYEIYRLGEYIAPNRLPTVASSLLEYNEFTKYIVPIYFSLKDDRQAANFLASCKNPDLDLDTIEKNAKLCRVPDNLINIVRR